MIGSEETKAKLELVLEDRASKSLKATGKSVDSWTKNVKRKLSDANKSLGKTATYVGALTAALALLAAKKGLDYLNRLGEIAEETDNLSKTTGLAVETLQEFRHIEDQTAVKTGTLSTAFVKLQKRMYDAAVNGSADAVRAFERVGISMDELTGPDGKVVDAGPIWERIAAYMQNVGSESEKSALAAAFFGRGFAKDVVPALEIGAQKFAELRGEAHKFKILTAEEIAELRKWRDTMDRLNKSFDATYRKIALTLLPEIQELTEKLEDFAKSESTKDIAKDWKQAFGVVVQAIGFAAFTLDNFIAKATRVPATIEYIQLGLRAYVSKKWGSGEFYKEVKPILDKYEKEDAKLRARQEQLVAFFFGKRPVKAGAKGQDIDTLPAEEWGEFGEGDLSGKAPGLPGVPAPVPEPEAAIKAKTDQEVYAEQERARRLIEQAELFHLGELDQLRWAQAQERAIVAAHDLDLEAIESKHRTQIRNLRHKMRMQDLKDAAGFFGSLASLTERSGQEQSKTHKRFARAEAYVNMWAGASHALRLPWPKSLFAFAQVLATGKKALDAIDQGGGGGGGAGGGGGIGGAGAAPAEPEQIPQATTGKVDQRSVTVNMLPGTHIVNLDTFVRESLAKTVKDAMGDGVDFGVERVIFNNG